MPIKYLMSAVLNSNVPLFRIGGDDDVNSYKCTYAISKKCWTPGQSLRCLHRALLLSVQACSTYYSCNVCSVLPM